MTMKGGETTKRLCIIFMAAAIICLAMFPGKGFAATPGYVYVDLGRNYDVLSIKTLGTGSINAVNFYNDAGSQVATYTSAAPLGLTGDLITNLQPPLSTPFLVRYIRYNVTSDNYSITKVTVFSQRNAQGTGIAPIIDVSETPPPLADLPPVSPSGLVAAPAQEKVTLSWDRVRNATTYDLYLDGVKVGSTASLTYTFDLKTIKQYTFSVSAVNDFGTSGRTSITATPLPPPPPPPPPDTTPPSVPVLSGKPGKNQAVLTWTRSPESDLAGYNLYQDGSKVGNYTTNGATVSGLKNGTEYKFRVTSVDTTGNESAKSNQIAVTPVEKMDVNLIPNGDSIVVQIVSGGTGPYVINWGAAQKTVDQSQYVIQNLQYDTEYTVTITDANGLTYTSKINTGTEKGYIPPTFPNPQNLFQRMIDSFSTAGSIAIAVIGGAIALGLLVLLAYWGWLLLKRWIARTK